MPLNPQTAGALRDRLLAHPAIQKNFPGQSAKQVLQNPNVRKRVWKRMQGRPQRPPGKPMPPGLAKRATPPPGLAKRPLPPPGLAKRY